MRFAAIGRTELLYDTILALRSAGHELTCIITAPAAPEYTRNEIDFEQLADDIGCPFTLSTNLDEENTLEKIKDSELAVSVNWPFILTQEILGLFPKGVLNIHAGDLPRYRGNACLNWAILQGDDQVCLSVHIMQPGQLDCGPVLVQRSYPVIKTTDYQEIMHWIQKVTPKMFCEALDHLTLNPKHALKIAKPNAPEAFRCYPRVPEDGWIDWQQEASMIHRLVRASTSPLPGAYTYRWYKSRLEKIIILQTRIPEETLGMDLAIPGQVLRNDTISGESLVACGNKTILALKKCRIEGNPPFAPGSKWNTFRVRLGVRAEDILWRYLKKQGLAH